MEKFYSLLFVLCSYFSIAQIQKADSLFFAKNYKEAKLIYLKEKTAIDSNTLALNRLGYCYHKTNKYNEAIECYLKSEKLSKNQILSFTVESRLAKTYSVLDQNDKSLTWLKRAITNGYANIVELNTDPDFSNLRKLKAYTAIYDSLYNLTFPCKKDPKKRLFDFWLGTWDVYTTQGNQLAGESVIENISEGCAILENYKSLGGYVGKSINFVNEKGEWEQDWMGSDGHINRFYKGDFVESEMLFIFEKTDQAGNKKIGKFHFYKIGDNTVRQMQESSADNGKTYAVDYDLTYKRKNK
ncbi:MAG: tetratricopeptide repeat protein [Bacteroidia bacterium]